MRFSSIHRAVKPMLMTLAQMDTGEAKTVIDEIINAQKTGVLTAATGETAPVGIFTQKLPVDRQGEPMPRPICLKRADLLPDTR